MFGAFGDGVDADVVTPADYEGIARVLAGL